MTVALILTGALLTIASCLAAGRLAFRCAGLPNELTGSLQFTTGAALLSTAIFALCAVHAISVVSLTALGLALVCGASFSLRGASTPQPRPTLWWIPFTAFGIFYFVNALAPEISADGAFYHLAFPARYLQHGGFFRNVTNFYGNLSQGLEMLFLMAFAIGKHSAGALTHFAFLIALASALTAFGTYTQNRAAGWLAALIVFTSPVIAMDATVAYNDVAVAAVLFSLFYALTRYDRERSTNWLIAAGLLAGFAYAIKYTAALAVPYAIGFVLWRTRSLKAAVILTAAAAVMIAPWMLKNWIWLSNPVSPFFNRTFPNPNVTIDFEDEYRANLRHFNGAQLNWHIPIDVTVTGNKVQGNLGPAFLLAPLALAGIRSTEVRRLLFAGTVFLLPWFLNLGTRFLIPCAPFFALALAITIAKCSIFHHDTASGAGLWPAAGLRPALAGLRGRRPRAGQRPAPLAWNWAVAAFAIAQTIVSWPSIVGLYCEPYNWRLVDFPLPAALRQIPEEDFIAPRIDTYNVAKMVDRNTPPGSVIYTAWPLPEAYSERTYVLNYAGALNQSIQEMRWTPFLTDLQPLVRLTFHPAGPVDKFRLVQKGNCGGRWSISEIRWTPDRAATLTAQPEPWNVQWAHDGNPATRWKIWQPAKPGMYFQAAFANSAPLDSVEIDAAPDQSNTCIQLETQSGTAENPEIRAIPLPDDIRRRAIEAIRAQGVTHLLIHQDERAAADFDTRQSDWGIAKIAVSGKGTLYRIEIPAQNIGQK